jgi:hypothetical protein
MNRFPRLISCLVLLGFAGTGVPGMGLCICADGDVALETVCDGTCRDAEEAPYHQQHGECDMRAAACIDSGGDCVYLPLSLDAMLPSLSKGRHSLSAKNLLPRTFQAGGLNDGVDFDVRLNASRVLRRTPLHMSAALLAQRTIVLRI